MFEIICCVAIGVAVGLPITWYVLNYVIKNME